MYVTIKTSQHTFITDPEGWLGNSIYFDNLFSDKWADKQDGGSYFIESDANIFEHILRYLRAEVLPVFYDRLLGHDFPLYQGLLEESQYFAIDGLQKWLCERKYLDAVKIHYTATETQDRDRFVEIESNSNMEITMVPITQKRNSFYCPNAKNGKSSEEYCRGCIRQARDNGIPGLGGWRTEDELKWCIMRMEVIFDHLCVSTFRKDH
ncbi:hypothetical protein TCE0_029f07873 [Talaromyces pinophilus]|uniref:Potassium channel tetramerisation-type BTB domain-containing protein n=1 Tax=Talaromyces pinophilus TaxID=128442 RepID=A0A0B8N3G1_TALPI|nr:hypothetical protein TCE0_029f07873 [Talaromyces pinophilus]